jgi:uncharacterized membrane protein YbhN (UPF0104 family)
MVSANEKRERERDDNSFYFPSFLLSFVGMFLLDADTRLFWFDSRSTDWLYFDLIGKQKQKKARKKNILHFVTLSFSHSL